MDCRGRKYDEEGAQNWKTGSKQLQAFTAPLKWLLVREITFPFLVSTVFPSFSATGRNAKLSAMISIQTLCDPYVVGLIF
jgi:hypothetical protein